ncbi:MAG TPA: sigma-54 dependent transcriptional regulator [Candidatus Eisenbacteria bacterium]|jgi:DNA-binding NtrC family response regulator
MQKQKPVVLVVDRASDATKSLVAFLRENDLAVEWRQDGESAFNVLDDGAVDCLVAELKLPRIDGMALLEHARQRNPEVCAVLIAEGAGVELAVEAMRRGAYDFQVKPLNLGKLLEVLRRGLSHQTLAARAAEMEGQLDERFGFEQLTGHSRAIARVVEQLRHIAPTRATVLIEGETGTGKGVVAQAIHQNSPRRGGQFVAVNVGALAGGVVESELFGHEGGALTGTSAPQRGRFEIADGGTLFLDEIGEAPPTVQVRLLRAIQDRAFERVGGTENLKSDVRLIAASNRDLAADVQSGRFREDLYSRLSVVRVEMPPLRERLEDIPLLTESFLREFNRDHGRRVTGITRGVLERLMAYPWPGNVRELSNAIEGMVVFAQGRRPLDLSDLPERLRSVETRSPRLELAVGMTVEEAERQLIAATLRATGQDKPRAAAMLGIGLRTLYRKIKQYGIH